MTARNLVGPVFLLLTLQVFSSSEIVAAPWEKIAPHLRRQALSRAESGTADARTRFVSLPAQQTGVDFVNRLDWDHPQGLLFHTGYACGGIAVGDVDGNGLPDLFFASGLGRNRLYLQQTAWRFVESATAAGLPGDDAHPLGGDAWATGAALLDIDNDGDLDLYVCHYGAPNALYLNRGDGTFDERAADYGLDITDACLMPAVADYDRDGDLDIYLAVNRYLEEVKFHRRELFYWRDGMEYLRPAAEKYFAIRRHFNQPLQLNMWTGCKDRLLRNEGPGKKFTDVSESMGLERGDALSATWWDYDHDGWPDLYVGNDLAAPDRLFHNQRNGQFEDVALESLPHTPWLAMGASAGDVDNDGRVDFLIADMAFRTHFKDKVFMGDMSSKFRNVGFFPHDQLMRNALFVNTGTNYFQEAAYLAGLATTDWTWTAKLADLDNDGRLDAFFTNGSPVNLGNSVELNPQLDDSGALDTSVVRQRYSQLPPVLEQNLAYQNQGDLRFTDRSQSWGLDHVGMSFASVHADLDRDGDLDLVVANLDEPPTLYRNESDQQGILVQLQGKRSNRRGVGAEIIVESDSGRQVRQLYPVAGFLACQETTTHFGLGDAHQVRRMTVRWPSGAEQVFENLLSGQLYLVDEPEAISPSAPKMPAATPLFIELPDAIVAEHHEEPFDDFTRQPLLPNKLSQLGPPMAWGDVDSDGDIDLFLGESADWLGMIYLNQGNMQFQSHPQVALARDAASEDSAAEFLDANNDGHLDLYVGSGSVEFATDDPRYQDRLYLGDGNGSFMRAPDGWLPELRISTAAVAVSDFDHDGDGDLVVGGRSIPGEYPLPPAHAVLRNEGDHFVDVLAEVAPELAVAGMITAAEWADVDGDGWDDLLLAIDWGPVRLFRNQQGRLVEATEAAGLVAWTGWWQSLACADLDNDGDVDLVAGNFGLNTKYQASSAQPVLCYYGEYGDSGKSNLIEASYEGEVLFPLRGKSCSSAAMPHLTERFKTYEAFAQATLAEIYTPNCLQQARRFEINTLSSVCFLNDGAGRFKMVPLPRTAQLAPVFAIAVTEVNGDDVPDLFLAQNFFSPQQETGPMDGGLGVVAVGRGDGTFSALRPDRAGVVVPGDAKAAAAVDCNGDGRRELFVATNNGPLHVFRQRAAGDWPLQSAVELPTSSWSQQNLSIARQFLDSDQSEQALPYLRRALKVAPRNPQALLMLATARHKQGRFGEASGLLRRVRELGGVEQMALLLEEGRLFYSLNQYDRAAEILERAAISNPNNRRIHKVLGDVRFEQGKLGEAREHFQRAGRSDSVDEVEQRAVVASLLFEQGLEAQRNGQDAEAIRFFEKSRRVDSRPRTLRSLASILESAQDQQLRDVWLAEQLKQWAETSNDNP